MIMPASLGASWSNRHDTTWLKELPNPATQASIRCMITHRQHSLVSRVLTQHAGRNFGRSGFREVLLTVWTKGQPAISYRIFHVWKSGTQSCWSLFFLVSPSALSGTSVRLVEEPYLGPKEVWLRLKTAEQPLCVAPMRFVEPFLGTDFSYEDLCFWLPTKFFDIEDVEINICSGKPEYCLYAKRAQCPTAIIRVLMEGESWVPIRIEWLDPEAHRPQKIYTASDLIEIDGIWTPRLISVSRPEKEYKSEMVLKRASHSINIESGTVLNKHLTQLSASFFDTWAATATLI